MILFENWNISVTGPLAQQYDHLSRRLEVSGDIPGGWEWDVLVQVGEHMDIIALTPCEGGLYAVLTREQLGLAGYYALQLRGRCGDVTKHTNVAYAAVRESLSGDVQWPEVPSAFSQMEARMEELTSHPPVPGEEGLWLIWDADSDQYVTSQFPLPAGSAGGDTPGGIRYVTQALCSMPEAAGLEQDAHIMAVQEDEHGQPAAVRVPLTAANAELYDARKDLPAADGTAREFDKVGDFVRDLSRRVSQATQADPSTLDLVVLDGKLHICSAADKDTGYGDGVVYGGGGSGGSGATLVVVNNMPARDFSVLDTDEKVEISYTWSSTDASDGQPTGEGSTAWFVGSERVSSRTVAQGDNVFDVKPYLISGETNVVKLVLEDSYGNSRTIVYNITVVTYGLSWNLSQMSYHGGNALSLRLTPTGQGVKTLKVTVDGNEVHSEEVSSSGRTSTVTIPAQTHGAHVLLAWMETEVEGEVKKTEPLRHVGIWTVEGNPKKIVAVYQPRMTATQFGTISIQYMAIDPAGDTAAAELKRGEKTLSALSVGRGIQTWAYKADNAGLEELSVVCGTSAAQIALTVEALGYDVQPVTAGLVLDVDPSGHSNDETDRNSFGYTDSSGTNHPFVYSENFDWVNGGFVRDEDGVTAFVVKRGCTASLDCSLFADDPRALGKNIKLIYKSELVRNYDATLMSCKAGNVGLVVQAQQATVSSELQSMTVPYCEDRKIEMDISIEPDNADSLAMICLKAIPSCKPVQYGATDSWVQADPTVLTIGSEDCDVWIYRIKMYDCYLNRYEILDNYIADCADPEEIVKRYVRNDIYNDDGSISLSKLAQAAPGLRTIHLKAPRMTTGKSDKVSADVEMTYTEGGEAHHLIAKGAAYKAQGTSSLEYVLAALNLDLDFGAASSWVNGLGEDVADYAFTENSIPVSYFNLKANVASSESANNVMLADDYNSYTPYLCQPRKQDSRVRDCVEGHPCAVFFTNTSNTTVEAGARPVAPGETILYFAGDMNNSKKNLAVFGQDAEKYPMQCCVEILNNTNAPCRFRGENWDNEAWDGDGDFEFRAPGNPTAEMKQAFREMHSWVVSTCRDQATGAELPEGVAYGGKMYYYDSQEYRGAKFLAEFENYFVKEQMLFHYLFTERHCMTDNRAKNVFMCYEYAEELDGYRWSVRCNYDNDTAEGCDNSGGATFTYGLEDVDLVGNTHVFNAHDSTLWCNIRDLMGEELTAAYISNKECWDARRILDKFLAHQEVTPEALRIEDMYNKYVAPLLLKNDGSYLKRCFGTKEYWREQFEVYQEIYMNSKYCDQTDRSNAVTTRVTTQEAAAGNLELTPYSDMYLVVQYGNGGTAKVRAKRGSNCTVLCPADTLTDTETYLYSASHLTRIGSMAAMVPKFVTLTHASRLQSIAIGSQQTGYQNLNYTDDTKFGNSPMLEHLDLSGLPNMTYDLDLSAQTGLQELYAVNSGITGVTFAQGAPLRKAKLPALANLTARDLEHIEQFEMDGDNLVSIRVENCPGIDTLALCKAASGLNRARLTDIDWHDTDADTLLRLAGLRGMDDDGKITETVVLSGKAHLTTATEDELDRLEELLPQVEVTYDMLVTGLNVTFVNYDGTVLNSQKVRYGKDAVNPITAGYISTPVKPPTDTKMYEFRGWSEYFTNVTTDLTITAVFAEKDRVCVVRWWADMAETQLLQEDVVDVMGSAYYRGDDLPDGTDTVWLGWDKSANLVADDMNIHARYAVPSEPVVSPEEYDFLYSDDPADNSAFTISDFYGACLSEHPENYFSIGDEIKIVLDCNAWSTLGDTPIILQVYGFRHFKKADGSGEFSKVVFGCKGAVWARQMNSANTNAGGWYATALRSWLIGTVFPLLPAHWRRMIELVNVISTRGDSLSTTVTSEDRLFLFSQMETGQDSNAPYSSEVDENAESKILDIFTDNASRLRKTLNGTGNGANWWLRSPQRDTSDRFCYVYNNNIVGNTQASVTHWIVFGFCIG